MRSQHVVRVSTVMRHCAVVTDRLIERNSRWHGSQWCTRNGSATISDNAQVCHRGRGTESGHYYAVSYDSSTDAWLYFGAALHCTAAGAKLPFTSRVVLKSRCAALTVLYIAALAFVRFTVFGRQTISSGRAFLYSTYLRKCMHRQRPLRRRWRASSALSAAY